MFCLCQSTNAKWVTVALSNLDAVLADHAHCEMKAATTALSLALKNHDDLEIVITLTALAEEELDHFKRVIEFLRRRAMPLGLPPVDQYAAKLRKTLATLPSSRLNPIVDRLLVGALIEARSCERFKLLLDAWPSDGDPELRDFYRALFECEAHHYVQYRDLAVRVARGQVAAVEARLHELAEAEGRVVAELAGVQVTASVHG